VSHNSNDDSNDDDNNDDDNNRNRNTTFLVEEFGLSDTLSPSTSFDPSVSSASSSNPKSLQSIYCDDGLPIPIQIDITTDSFPQETSWKIINDVTSASIATGGPYHPEHKPLFVTKSYEVCPSDCLNFTIFDTYSNGMNDNRRGRPGSYTIFYDNETIREGGDNFGKEESTIFGACAPSPVP